MRIGQIFTIGLALAVAAGAAPKDNLWVSAAKNSDNAAVRTLLKDKSADVNTAEADGTTALHWAVHNNDMEMVDALLAAGAKVSAANRYGVQPISLAAENGNAAMIQKLLKAGADANATMPEGETVLMTAARNGDPATIKALLVAGAKVNARDNTRGQTALMWAASRGNAGAIKTLVEFGGDVKLRTNNAPRSAERKNETGFNVFASLPPTSFSALTFAVRAGHIDAARALLEAGADVNETVSDGQSLLVIAVANAHWELASFLLDKGADPNAAGAGWNALHQAIRERRPNIGFGTPGPIPTGNLDSIEVIKKMIAKGADLNARMTKNGMKDGQRNRLNRLGATPFFLAAKVTDVEVMKVLMAAHADTKTATADGTTPLMVASGLYLWNPGEDGGSLQGQEQEVLEAVKLCVEQGGNDVNAKNMKGETPLHGAAYRGANLVIDYLVSKGADLMAKDEHGWTPLTVANGINYSDFYKAQPIAAEALKKLMVAKGLPTEGMVADGKECLDCLQTRTEQARSVIERDKKMEAEFAAQYSSGKQNQQQQH